MTETTTPTTGYAPVNGLQMYYEIHGTGNPIIFMHGGISNINTDFGALLPLVSVNRQVIAVELQSHGRTADIDRPLRYAVLAEDIIALMDHLGLEQADLLGYSVGSAVALEVAIQRPERVRKLVLFSVSYNKGGDHPEMSGGMEDLQPEHLLGTPFADEYARIAPNADDWATLIERIKEMDKVVQEWEAETIRGIKAPVFLAFGDSDIIRPEHAVEMFRLFGGGVAGDVVGLPTSQLAILPGTTHITLVHHADWLAAMIEPFLSAPMPEAASGESNE
jgi:pimeloyl-ACP methyl ester carboxylesterase